MCIWLYYKASVHHISCFFIICKAKQKAKVAPSNFPLLASLPPAARPLHSLYIAIATGPAWARGNHKLDNNSRPRTCKSKQQKQANPRNMQHAHMLI